MSRVPPVGSENTLALWKEFAQVGVLRLVAAGSAANIVCHSGVNVVVCNENNQYLYGSRIVLRTAIHKGLRAESRPFGNLYRTFLRPTLCYIDFDKVKLEI